MAQAVENQANHAWMAERAQGETMFNQLHLRLRPLNWIPSIVLLAGFRHDFNDLKVVSHVPHERNVVLSGTRLIRPIHQNFMGL
jgi:hypothetical protein